MPTDCIVCGAPTQVQWPDLYDDRYGSPGRIAVTACPACGHKRADTNMTAAEIADLYTSRYPRAAIDLTSFTPHHEVHGLGAWLDGAKASAFRWVPKKVSILDIGCGAGETLAYHAARGCQAVGVEADANVQRVAERFGLDIRPGLFDPSAFAPEAFDYVTMDQVIEHVAEPSAFLASVARALKPGGVVVLSTPNSESWTARLLGRRWMNWHVPYHLHHFTRRSMVLTAAQAGLQMVSIRTLTNSDWLRLQVMHLLSRPQPGEISTLWDPGRSSRPRRRGLDLMARGIARLRLLHPIVRAADALGVGDNLLVILRKAG